MSKKIAEFNNLIEELLKDPLVQNMSTMKQHSSVANLLEHLVYTSYVSYRICDAFKLNKKETVRAALLHDFRLRDSFWIKVSLSHSKRALKNATKRFKLSEFEKNIILSHMWPLTPHLFPKSKEALIVNIADTFCTIMEVLRLYKKTKTTKKLALLTLCE